MIIDKLQKDLLSSSTDRSKADQKLKDMKTGHAQLEKTMKA